MEFSNKRMTLLPQGSNLWRKLMLAALLLSWINTDVMAGTSFVPAAAITPQRAVMQQASHPPTAPPPQTSFTNGERDAPFVPWLGRAEYYTGAGDPRGQQTGSMTVSAISADWPRLLITVFHPYDEAGQYFDALRVEMVGENNRLANWYGVHRVVPLPEFGDLMLIELSEDLRLTADQYPQVDWTIDAQEGVREELAHRIYGLGARSQAANADRPSSTDVVMWEFLRGTTPGAPSQVRSTYQRLRGGIATAGDVGGPVMVQHEATGSWRMSGILSHPAATSYGNNAGVIWTPFTTRLMVAIERWRRNRIQILQAVPGREAVTVSWRDACGAPQQASRQPSQQSSTKETSCDKKIDIFYKRATQGSSWTKALKLTTTDTTHQATLPLAGVNPKGALWAITLLAEENGKPVGAGADGKPFPGHYGGEVVITTTQVSLPSHLAGKDMTETDGKHIIRLRFAPSSVTSEVDKKTMKYVGFCKYYNWPWSQAQSARTDYRDDASYVTLDIPVAKAGLWQCSVVVYANDQWVAKGADGKPLNTIIPVDIKKLSGHPQPSVAAEIMPIINYELRL